MHPPEAAPTLPPWQVTQWFNTTGLLQLAGLRGRVVLIHAFQMLCPGCVAHGLPLAARVHEACGGDALSVVGLHCVFEHHEVMGPEALRAFIHEYRLRFPIGVDAPAAAGAVPQTMALWQLRGTPSTLLLDRAGRLRLHHFGHLDELQLGLAIGQLLTEPQAALPAAAAIDTAEATAAGCADGACVPSRS